jgi:hypothetical protein
MAKLNVLGLDTSVMVDGSELLPVPKKHYREAYFVVDIKYADVQYACSATSFSKLAIMPGPAVTIPSVWLSPRFSPFQHTDLHHYSASS